MTLYMCTLSTPIKDFSEWKQVDKDSPSEVRKVAQLLFDKVKERMQCFVSGPCYYTVVPNKAHGNEYIVAFDETMDTHLICPHILPWVDTVYSAPNLLGFDVGPGEKGWTEIKEQKNG